METDICPKCGMKMVGFSGNEGIPNGVFCPSCNDAVYDDKGNKLQDLE